MKQNDSLHRQFKTVSPAIRELAARIGCNETQITRWTKGFPNFTLQSLAKLSIALGEDLIQV